MSGKQFARIARANGCGAGERGEALQDLLLSVLAPAQSRMKACEDLDLNLLARQTIGEKANLFDITRDGDELIVSVRSGILKVESLFPLRIGPDENVVVTVKKHLKRQ